MEAAMGEGRKLPHHVSGRMTAEQASPERGRPAYAPARSAPARPMRRVQIIYYLCRNGQLEHPHFMELAQHPHQPLRLKDVMDKLTVLRGKGMPALFSWSCKRNYKNGYVWNDLSDNDVIYPSDGVEYVLKGSEIFPGCSSVAADRFQHLRMTDRSPTKPPLALPANSHKQYVETGYRDDAGEEDPEDEEQLAYPYHRRAAAARLGRHDNKPVSVRTSRGHPVELPVEETSPPSSTSSDKPRVARQASRCNEEEAEPNRAGSMLLQLIACGSATAGSAKCGGGRAEPRRSCGLVSRLSSRAGAEEEDEDEEGEGGELSRRLGQMRVDEKEYFSGSIVESGGRGTPLPASSLKRSNSYNEERGSRLGAGAIGAEAADERTIPDDGMVRGRCIPGRKRHQPQQQK